MQKVIFVLPHSFEPSQLSGIKEPTDLKTLDHFSTRFITTMRKYYDFELWLLSSKLTQAKTFKHKEGFTIRAFPRDRKLPLPLESSKSMLAAVKRAAKTQPKLLWHINSYYLLMTDSIAKTLKEAGRNYIIQHRGGGFTLKALPYSIYKYWFKNRTTLRNATLVLVEHTDEAKRVKKNYTLSNSKVILAPNPVPIERVTKTKKALRKELGLPLDKRILLYAGRLASIKGTLNFVKEAVKNLNPRIHLVIIGEGPEKARIAKLATANMSLLPWLSRKRLFDFLNAADVFVHPNKKSEGAPNALIEALGSGLPLAGFDIEGVRDIITNKTGMLHKNKDVASFVNAVNKFTISKRLEKIGAACKKHYQERFLVKSILQTYKKAYEVLRKAQ